MKRRTLLMKSAVAAGAAALLNPGRSRGQDLSANAEVAVGVVGAGIRGPQVARDLLQHDKNTRIAAICDCDSRRAEKMASQHAGAAAFTDYRKMLEMPGLDAVVVATPNHTHVLIALAAIAAGKDVYVEKPVSHNVREGRILADAAKRGGRIVQAGLQNRSDAGIDAARDYYLSGALGALKSCHAFWFNARKPIGKVTKPVPVDKEIDFDLFQGPRALVPVMRGQFHYDWHWFWDTGNGEFGNVAVHNIDHTMHLLNLAEHAVSVQAVGGRFLWEDNAVTPNSQLAVLRFAGLDVPVTCEIRNLAFSLQHSEMKSRFRKRGAGTYLTCEKGVIFFNRGGGFAEDNDGKEIERFSGDGGGTHAANWMRAVRSRDAASLRCPIGNGHISSSLSHIANISLRIGERGVDAAKLRGNPPTAFAPAAEAWESFFEHLAQWPIDFAKTPMTLGPELRFLPESERFDESTPDGVMANYLIDETYRAPHTLPQV